MQKYETLPNLFPNRIFRSLVKYSGTADLVDNSYINCFIKIELLLNIIFQRFRECCDKTKILKNCTCRFVIAEPLRVSDPAAPVISKLCDHIVPSAPVPRFLLFKFAVNDPWTLSRSILMFIPLVWRSNFFFWVRA